MGVAIGPGIGILGLMGIGLGMGIGSGNIGIFDGIGIIAGSLALIIFSIGIGGTSSPKGLGGAIGGIIKSSPLKKSSERLMPGPKPKSSGGTSLMGGIIGDGT
jgi:hypothetical protein